ncbi:methylenetetrahydrofolate reductase (NADPH) [Planktotalea frisia]|uniref:Methylenetetrahydrofolate reductase (NAD(P)H) n=1 Tax=Planktotalea frisia TaxID=696762 RepID=A0A1L9NZE1_9RHOB|nr:hypothetical protein [Planktotalea frisia]MCO4839685.1 hypothetical protein [Paracoccaceae bacterium]OJI94637.1 hypothetical protein PFRI_11860 [Planktotalea frisia]PZX35685.1 methylenetetrahydrofolate reductase (NADPH) [Planktotalea frisia]
MTQKEETVGTRRRGTPVGCFSSLRYLSLEATPKTVCGIVGVAPRLPAGTPVNIAWLDGSTSDDRLTVAHQLRNSGLSPVPIISARRVTSKADLFAITEHLVSEVAPTQYMVVGGDPRDSAGPFDTAADLFSSDWLDVFGIDHVVLPGFPEGNRAAPKVDSAAALFDKLSVLKRRGCNVEITTQLAMDSDKILGWIKRLRDHGFSDLVRIGLVGPAPLVTVKRYLNLFDLDAARLEEASEDGAGTVQFSPLFKALEDGFAAAGAGKVGVHLYPFGGANSALDWFSAVTERGDGNQEVR